ncbi:hypothetical protein BJV78DRAFT_1232297 [Lactifluus subvellereus]|nr:hypothetical protein BJV78DRAFT_1232297 [Lactifluus subvellereus]
MEDIILVTGCHRTRSWTNVAFLESQADAQVSFGVDRITWQFSRKQTQGAVLNRGPGGTDLAEDQCIFVRGFRVTRLLKILPRQLRGAAEHAPDPDGYDCEPDTELISIPPMTKYRDPLHLLLDYIAEVRAPDCDMVLVHDDDLERIEGIGDGTVSRHLIVNYIVFFMFTVTGNPSTEYGDGLLPDV